MTFAQSRFALFAGLFFLFALSASAQSPRKIIIDEDARGPATTDQQAILALIQSPQAQVLGITVVTGDGWRDEEIAHTLRMLEIIGRTDIPVVPGAVFPLDNSPQFIAHWETLYGKVVYQGAWNWTARGEKLHGPFEIPPLIEGAPHTAASSEDAAHFLIRMVHLHPHQVTIYAGGPLTDLALAIIIDPHFAELAQELVVMGGSINPQTTDPEFRLNPRREFNFWMDPEATHAVLRAPWAKITDTPVDISIKTRLTKQMIAEIAKSNSPAAQYIAKYADEEYMWDELAAIAWLDPSIITRTEKLYLDASTDPGPSYGDTLAWLPANQPHTFVVIPNPVALSANGGEGPAVRGLSGDGRRSSPAVPGSPAVAGTCCSYVESQPVTVNVDLDPAKFYRAFIALMTRPTPRPNARSAQ